MTAESSTMLTFEGTDLRGLLDVLIDAVEIASKTQKEPKVRVNGKECELLNVASLLPDDDLLPDHQGKIDSMFSKKQYGYRRTAHNLAHRAHQIETQNVRRMALVSLAQEALRAGSLYGPGHHNYSGRALSDKVVQALTKAGVDFPEKLLFMSKAEVAAVPGIGKAALKEISDYVLRFRPFEK